MTRPRLPSARSVITTAALLAVLAVANALVERVRAPARAMAQTVLQRTGLGKPVALYRHFAFDLPRLTTAAGVSLLLGIAAIRLYLLAAGAAPTYLDAYFALIGALATFACAGMLAGRRPRLVQRAWALGALVALAALVMYIVSRTLGLPGLPQFIGEWHYTLGTFAMALSGAYLAAYFAVLTGLSVAYPEHQHWHD